MSGFDEKLVNSELEHAMQEPTERFAETTDALTDVYNFMDWANMDMLEEPRFDEDKIQLWHDKLMAEQAKKLRIALTSVINDAQRKNSLDYVATPTQLAAIANSALKLVWDTLCLLYALGYDVPQLWVKLAEEQWKSVNENSPSNHGAKLPGA